MDKTNSEDNTLNKNTESKNHSGNHPLLSRKWLTNQHIVQDTVNKKCTFSIVSYNILAECHAVKGFCNGEDYLWTTEEKLRNDYRHELIWKELEYLDADIYCLQEVPPWYFDDVLVPAFREKGYDGVFIKRKHLDYDEGEATFYRTKRFTCIKSQGFATQDLIEKNMEDLSITAKTAVNQALRDFVVFMLTQLKCNQTGVVLNVANIHVSWEFLKRPDIQCPQISAAINELVKQAGGVDKPHIICGDFNSTPDCPSYQLICDGFIKYENRKLLQDIRMIEMSIGDKTSLIDLYSNGFRHASNTLKSAYKTIQDVEPKTCDPPLVSLDYIWFSSSTLRVTKVRETCDVKWWTGGIPNAMIPSDHISIHAEIEILST